MPTSASLVTNLPADFNTFGQGVDTSLQDLLGGTTGQVLSKTSNTNMDFTWITPQVGDITGVTAGTGITGGGTSGTVTITNDMATTITAAGDIVVGTGSGTYDNLPIGTTAQVLTADTTVSPYKVKWATPSSGGVTFAGCSVYKSGNQSITSATKTTLTFDSEKYDTDGYHDNTTNNSRITIPSGKAGYYLITSRVEFSNNATGSRSVFIAKNGSVSDIAVFDRSIVSNVEYETVVVTTVANCAVADYFEVKVYQGSGSALNVIADDPYTSFSMSYLGA